MLEKTKEKNEEKTRKKKSNLVLLFYLYKHLYGFEGRSMVHWETLFILEAMDTKLLDLFRRLSHQLQFGSGYLNSRWSNTIMNF